MPLTSLLSEVCLAFPCEEHWVLTWEPVQQAVRNTTGMEGSCEKKKLWEHTPQSTGPLLYVSRWSHVSSEPFSQAHKGKREKGPSSTKKCQHQPSKMAPISEMIAVPVVSRLLICTLHRRKEPPGRRSKGAVDFWKTEDCRLGLCEQGSIGFRFGWFRWQWYDSEIWITVLN